MNILIDTNAYTDFCKQIDEKIVSKFQSAEKIFVPFIVIAELRAGFLCGTKARENEKGFNKFLNSYRVIQIFPDNETILHYAILFMQLKKQGTPIPTNDIWIASLALQNKIALLSNDKHFKKIPQLILA